MNNYSEEHKRHRKEYQKKYMPEYRARKRAERAAKDPAFAERSRKYLKGRAEQAGLTLEQKMFRTLEYNRQLALEKYRDCAALRAATDIDFALRSARTRQGIEECRFLSDAELEERRRQKLAEHKRNSRKRTKQAELSRACSQESARMLSEPSGCTAEP